MRIETPRDVPTHMLPNPDQYHTKVGRFLRRFSLDELPQLYNIFRGEMSFVGPRPALWNQYDLVRIRENYKANNIRPGLTGWAQVNGRDELPIPVKARLDGEYFEKMSFLLDIKIIIMTFKKVQTAEGVKL
jgi:O-antigen biosynthesis protein WbqP